MSFFPPPRPYDFHFFQGLDPALPMAAFLTLERKRLMNSFWISFSDSRQPYAASDSRSAFLGGKTVVSVTVQSAHLKLQRTPVTDPERPGHEKSRELHPDSVSSNFPTSAEKPRPGGWSVRRGSAKRGFAGAVCRGRSSFAILRKTLPTDDPCRQSRSPFPSHLLDPGIHLSGSGASCSSHAHEIDQIVKLFGVRFHLSELDLGFVEFSR